MLASSPVLASLSFAPALYDILGAAALLALAHCLGLGAASLARVRLRMPARQRRQPVAPSTCVRRPVLVAALLLPGCAASSLAVSIRTTPHLHACVRPTTGCLNVLQLL